MKTVKMTINPRIIEHLGSDLITSASVAIVELIKNSIDAKSKLVNVQFFDNVESVKKNDKLLVALDGDTISLLEHEDTASEILLIEDVGIGMNEIQLRYLIRKEFPHCKNLFRMRQIIWKWRCFYLQWLEMKELRIMKY